MKKFLIVLTLSLCLIIGVSYVVSSTFFMPFSSENVVYTATTTSENKTIQTTVDRLYEEYLNAISGLKRDINARNIHQSHQNIYFNCFIDYLKQSGNDVTFCASKQGQYMINRKRFKTFNGRSQYDCRQFGEAMNYHIQSLIPIDKSKKDGKIVLSRDDILIIFCQYPMCTPSLSRRQSNN